MPYESVSIQLLAVAQGLLLHAEVLSVRHPANSRLDTWCRVAAVSMCRSYPVDLGICKPSCTERDDNDWEVSEIERRGVPVPRLSETSWPPVQRGTIKPSNGKLPFFSGSFTAEFCT